MSEMLGNRIVEELEETMGGRTRKLILHIDGAARGNPGPAGIGGTVSDEGGELLLEISEYIGETTNNVAEYSALIFTLQSLAKFRGKELRVFSDSELLVQQLNGAYKVKNQTLKTYFGRVKELLQAYTRVEILHVAREENAEADKLANEAIDAFLAGEKGLVTLDAVPEQGQLF